MPTRMRAEQAISAFMTIAPIARQSARQAITRPEADGKADAAMPRIAASNGAKAGPPPARSGAAKQQSQPVTVRPASTPQPGPPPSPTRRSEVAVAASTVSAAPGMTPRRAPARRRTPRDSRRQLPADNGRRRLRRRLARQAQHASTDGADARQGGVGRPQCVARVRRAEPAGLAARVSRHRRTGRTGAGRTVAQRQRRGHRRRRRRRTRLARRREFVVRAARARAQIAPSRCAN